MTWNGFSGHGRQRNGHCNGQSDQRDIRINLSHDEDSESILGYIKTSLKREYQPSIDHVRYTERCDRVSTVANTPKEFEKFFLYGSGLCLDAVLELFTFRLMRAFMAILRILTKPSCIYYGIRQRLSAAQITDILHIFVLIVCCSIARHFDISVMYHLVRGKAIFNLLVLQSITDLIDGLLSGLGADLWDSLCWKATQPPHRRTDFFGPLPHLVLTIVYTLGHTLNILLQITALTVALHSHDKLVFTIVLSSNLLEIKTNMYRRIDRNYLFYIACLDIKERFHHSLLLFIVSLKIMSSTGWSTDYIFIILPDALWILSFEILADWVKLAFVAKFNKISSKEYVQYRITLAQDMVRCRSKLAATDFADVVSRRFGLNFIPISCVLVRGFCESFNVSGRSGFVILLFVFASLFLLKIVIGLLLKRYENWILASKEAAAYKKLNPDTDSQFIPPIYKEPEEDVIDKSL